MKKLVSAVGVVALAAVGLGWSAPPAAAAGTITPASATVRVGAELRATVSGCAETEFEDGESYSYQSSQIVLITGTGSAARMAGVLVGDRLTVPGWVDPAQPAVLAGSCVRSTYHGEGEPTREVVFTYPDAPVDVTPPTGTPATPVIAASRTTAAGGQVVRFTGSGCAGFDLAEVAIMDTADRSGRTPLSFLSGEGIRIGADGTFTIDLALNDLRDAGWSPDQGSGPVAEGTYATFAYCMGGLDDEPAPLFLFAEPLAIEVSGSNPSGSISLTRASDDADLVISGSGCTGGRTVTLVLRGETSGSMGAPLRTRSRALATGDVQELAGSRPASATDDFEQTLAVTPEADGTWSTTWTPADDEFDLIVQADCGDPLADGFRYVPRVWFEYHYVDLWVERASPTSSPVGGTVTVHVMGVCDDDQVATAVLLTEDERVVAESAPIALGAYELGQGTLTAPRTAGNYLLGAACDGEFEYAEDYEVFVPNPVAAAAPLPAHPTTGWPDANQRDTYHGKIGPISVPGMDMGEMEMDGGRARDLGPSELFIDVPRPEGDFAITKISFDLVDAAGKPVAKDSVHLHHVVIGNGSSKNPACPGGTFGLPGQIVAAAGAERTAMELPDPYGLIVKGSDDWAGVYDLMSMVDHDQTVFLTYDIELRRDVQNVRPVQSYFGSATGCSSFTWTVDGSGTPDVQQHYLTLPKAGRMVAAGAHIHNGGASADLVDDRGRTLCRSTLTLGHEPVHGMGHDGRLSMVGPDDYGYPPEFYDDDRQIESINGCALNEQVTAGQRVRFDATYTNDRARSGVMGIYTVAVWEGGGPAEPTSAPSPDGARPIPGRPNYTG